MEIIEVPDILVSKDGQLHSLRKQKIWKSGAGYSFGIGNGIVKNGNLYVLKELTPSLQTFVPSDSEAVGTTVNLVDERDSQVYRCIKMADGRWWLGENLKYNIAGSVYYNNDAANLATYGRLYSSSEALHAAPERWGVPSDGEWKALEIALGMTQEDADIMGERNGGDVGSKLRVGGDSGLDLQFGGYLDSNGSYYRLNTIGYYWTSMGYDLMYALNRYVNIAGAGVYRNTGNRANRFSVRLILNV